MLVLPLGWDVIVPTWWHRVRSLSVIDTIDCPNHGGRHKLKRLRAAETLKSGQNSKSEAAAIIQLQGYEVQRSTTTATMPRHPQLFLLGGRRLPFLRFSLTRWQMGS